MTIEQIRNLLLRYQPSKETVELLRSHPIVLLVGISGAGKDTIKKRLLESNEFYDFVSHTTRQMRANQGVQEIDGREYHFIDLDEAAVMLQSGEYIEANEYSANVYGTTVRELRSAIASGKIIINDMEIQGVDQYKGLAENTIAIFILPPSYEEWQKRIAGRYAGGDDNRDNVALRRQTAKKELRYALEKGYYHFVVNDSLDDTVTQVQAIAHAQADVNEDHARMVAEKLLQDIETNDRVN